MNGSRDCCTELSKSEREKQTSYINTYYVEARKSGSDDRICKAEAETQMERTNMWIPRGKVESVINWEIGTDIYAVLMPCIH